MIETLRKISIRKSLSSIFLYLLLGLMFTAVGGWLFYVVDKPLDYTDFKVEDVTTDLVVRLELTQNYGFFLERLDRKDATLCYTIQVRDMQDEIYYMMVLVPESYRQEMDRMAQLTAKGQQAEPLEMIGIIDRMSKEENETMMWYAFKKGLLKIDGFDSHDSVEEQGIFFPYKVAVFSDRDKGTATIKKIYLILFGFGVIITVWMVVWGILVLLGFSMRWLQKDIKDSGREVYQVEHDYTTAQTLSGKPFVRLGRDFLFCFDKATPRAPLRANIDNISLAVQRHQFRMSITLYKTYSIRVGLKDRRFLDITMPNKARAMSMIAILTRELEGVRVLESNSWLG